MSSVQRRTGMVSQRSSERAFLAVSALLFAVSAAVTIAWCASMSGMGGMPMPGGWTMSMTWMRMPGQTWLGAAASFLGMWVVMMVAMMLPSLVPMLWRYRRAVVNAGEIRLGRLTTLVGVGYFFVWMVFGMAVFPAGHGAGGARNAAAGVGARCSDRRRPSRAHRRRAPVYRLESTSPYLLPASSRALTARYRRMLARLGDMACFSASIAAAAVPI